MALEAAISVQGDIIKNATASMQARVSETIEYW